MCRAVAALALVLLGCRHGGSRAASPEAEPSVAPERIIAEIATLRGVPDRRTTRILFHDEATFAAALSSKVEGDGIGPSDADSAAFSLAFEFPPKAARQGSGWGDVYEEQLLGFYDEHTHAVHLRKALLGTKTEEEVAAVLAHEITHSLQRQHFAMPDLSAIVAEDQRLAQNAVVEGDAMLVMVAYVSQRNRIPLNRALVRAARSATDLEFQRFNRARGGDRALSSAPPLLRERMSFPYLHGMAFMAALYRAGGFPLLNRVYDKPPITSEQVLHPEKYLAGEGAVSVGEPEAPSGYERVLSGTVGELQVRAILSYCLPGPRAASAASGWGGDAFTIAVRDERQGSLLWSTVWDDEREAAEFERALTEYVRCTRKRAGTHVMPLEDGVRRKGKRVALVRGLPRARANAALGKLLALALEAQPAVPPFGSIAIPPLKQASPYRRPYLTRGRYVNEALGIVSRLPPDFSAELGGPTSITLSRKGPSPAVMGIELSEQLSSMDTVNELHAALAGEFRKLLENAELEYVRGRDVTLATLGSGIEREWRVAGTEAGLKAIVLPVCAGTGSLVFWGIWADARGLSALDWWLSGLARIGAGDPPLCVELNP